MNKMVNWKNVPFIRIILPMIAGILIAIYQDLNSHNWLYALGISFAVLVVIFIGVKKRPTLNKELLFGGWFYWLIFLVGVNLIVFKTAKNDSIHYQKIATNNEFLIEIVEIPKEKPNSIQVIANIFTCIDSNANALKSSGNVILYFEKDSASLRLLQGDKLYIQSDLNNIAPPVNPGQFNYKQYLEFNQIYQQGFVSSMNYKVLEHGGFSVISFAAGIRDHLLQILKENGLKDNEMAVASALILGYKDDLGEELKHSYSSAGATHVLAVSGLHVGIIFLVLNFLFNLLDKNDRFKITKTILLLLCLWFYATLTGLSPSVVRAATMFSFVAFGKSFARKSSIYNTLASSALVLLIYNPYLIMEVGFQLSYLAVLGIVYFQNLIYKRVYVKNKYLDYVWMITSVSIAAQLTTFPLGLLYFHQFPTYFFISNLFVIPGAMIIIGVGLLLFATSWIPFVSAAIGWFLSMLIYFMNTLVMSIDQLPFSLIEGISITILECWLVYVIIVFFVIGYESRKLKYILFALSFTVFFIGKDLYEDYHLSQTKQVVIYDIKNGDNINFISPNENFFIADSELFSDNSTMLFNVKHHWFDMDAQHPKHLELFQDIASNNLLSESGLYQFYDFKMFHYNEKIHFELDNPINIDVLYLTTNDFVDSVSIFQNFNPEIIVLGHDCNWKTRKWINENNLGFKVHNLKKEGAFMMNL